MQIEFYYGRLVLTIKLTGIIKSGDIFNIKMTDYLCEVKKKERKEIICYGLE